MSSVPHLPMAPQHLRASRNLLAVGLFSSALAGCAIWPKALTLGAHDAPLPAVEQAAPPPPAPPVVVEEAPKPSPAPVPASTADTAPLEPQPVMKSTPVVAPPEAPTAQAPAKAPAAASNKGKTKGKANAKATAHADARHQASAKAASPKSSGGDLVPGFYINVGLFAVPSNGTKAYRTLEKAELPVFTDVVKGKKGSLTRVRVGPYLTKALADAAAEKIKGMQLEAVVFQH